MVILLYVLLLILAASASAEFDAIHPPGLTFLPTWNWPVVSHRECVVGSITNKVGSHGVKGRIVVDGVSLSDQNFYEMCVNHCSRIPWCVAVEMKRKINGNEILRYSTCTVLTTVEILIDMGYSDILNVVLAFQSSSSSASLPNIELTWSQQLIQSGQPPYVMENYVDPSLTQIGDEKVICVVRGESPYVSFDLAGAGEFTGPAPYGIFTPPPTVPATQGPTRPLPALYPRDWVGIAFGISVVLALCWTCLVLGGGGESDVSADP